MTPKKTIVVMGATGLQGGSVVKFLLKDGTFSVRAVTRNSDSLAAKELDALGAQVVKADARDFASLEQAFKGAYGVFGITNFWESGVGAQGEITQGKLLVDAAKATDIQHFVWSTLESSEFRAAHLESKAEVNEYLKESGVPRTSLYTSFFYENFSGLMPPPKRDDGSYDFPLPLITDAPFAIYSAAETGAYVLAALLHPETWLNSDMRIASDFLSARELAKAMSEVSGKVVHVQEVDAKTFDALRGNGIPETVHASLLLLFATARPPFRDPALARQLYPGLKSFRAWAAENTENIFRE